MQAVLSSAQASISAASSSRLIAMSRAPGQPPSLAAPLDFTTSELRGDVISTELRRQVQSRQRRPVLAVRDSHGRRRPGSSPGIVVGSQLLLPSAGWYEVYIGYSLADVQQTLSSVQQTAAVAALALLLLIAGVTWVVVRLVVTPIRVAAETSEQLAAGDLEVRIPEKGEDVIATLARSFNGMADSLQSQIKELADLSEVQQRFVSDVSHELRTPSDHHPPGRRRALRPARLVHPRRRAHGRAPAHPGRAVRGAPGRPARDQPVRRRIRRPRARADEPRPPRGGCRREHARRWPSATAANCSSSPRAATSTSLVDPRRIRRILRNLLGNAIEHGEQRPIIVSVDSNATAVAIGVRDYGIGMTAEAADHVFDRFWRADPSRQRTIGGTGLGLAIALEDAVVHGGAIEVWSQPDAGSNFLIVLPRTIDSPARRVARSPSYPRTLGHRAGTRRSLPSTGPLPRS